MKQQTDTTFNAKTQCSSKSYLEEISRIEKINCGPYPTQIQYTGNKSYSASRRVDPQRTLK
jgi:hypothetical protein